MLASVLAVAGCGLSLLELVAIVLLILESRDAAAGERAAIAASVGLGKEKVIEERRADQAEKDRDAALARAVKAEAEIATLLKQDIAVQDQRNSLMEREADDAAHDVAAAPDGASALDRLNLVLGSVPSLPAVPAAGDGGGSAPAGADHGHAGPDAVQPAAVAGAADPGRHPAG